jgi:hypothetical protein
LLFTQIFALAIRDGSMPRLPGAPYVLSAALIFSAVILSWRVARPKVPEGVPSEQAAP